MLDGMGTGRVEQEVLKALFACLSDDGHSLILPAGTDERLVVALARHHRLSPALSMTDEAAISPGLLETFRRDRLVTLGRGTLLRAALVECAHALAAVGVTTVVLKGMAHEAMAYPVAGTRPASDIDILVRREARSSAFAVFRALGFHPTAGAPGFDEVNYHEVSLRRGDTNIDLHFGLAPFVRGAIDYEALWAETVALPIDGAPTYSLSRPHAALNQALHMAIHHFDVPGLYLWDLARLVTEPRMAEQVSETARAWRCLRPWQTATALTSAFIPAATPNLLSRRSTWPARTRRVVEGFGGVAPLPRAQQLQRKIEHLDTSVDVLKYLAIQGQRVLRERLRSLPGRHQESAAERLGW